MSALPDDLTGGQSGLDTQRSPAAGHPLDPDQARCDAQVRRAGVHLLHVDHTGGDAQCRRVGVDPLDPDHWPSDTHEKRVGVDPSAGDDQMPSDTQPRPVVAGISATPPAAIVTTDTTSPSSRVGYGLLALYASSLDELEGIRKATHNRIRALTDFGLDGTPEAARLLGLADGIEALEHDATLELQRAIRKHPLGPWVKAQKGLGEKTVGRLLGAIGNPADRATVSQLWAYCGYHVLPAGQARAEAQWTPAGGDPSSDPGQGPVDTHGAAAGVAPSRRKGQRANWNTDAKTRAFLVAEAAVKAGVRKLDHCDDTDGYDLGGRKATTPYGQVYLDGRAKYADALHPVECKRCGPAAKPAPVGSLLSLAHQHARAMRLVSKAILRDLWVAAKQLEGTNP